MNYSTTQSYKDRLSTIVETAYRVICQKIAGESISIYNEASLQLHLSIVLRTLAQLYEFSPSERVIIDLEKAIEPVYTSKTKGVSRCDIVISFLNNNHLVSQAYIELKYFKKSESTSEATKDHRFGLFMDIENLECYRNLSKDVQTLCYLIAMAQNETYANPDSRSSLKTGNGCMTKDSMTKHETEDKYTISYSGRDSISLKDNYLFDWTSYATDKHCLIVRMQ